MNSASPPPGRQPDPVVVADLGADAASRFWAKNPGRRKVR